MTAAQKKIEGQLSEFFKKECARRKFTQVQVVVLTKGKFDQPTVSELSNKKRNWNMSYLFTAANLFSMSVPEFICAATGFHPEPRRPPMK